ncbi:bifunctional DedA family/phosphatase PAP2 family protein [Stutzerimonas tarimensis]|uniref:Bifunctional DedA family/phosphatase PAP2 family protein n=1 Tax=Stutzerimonas tarimensis TaxID=1507735 RepID=A0ABV7TAH2_9GAMM
MTDWLAAITAWLNNNPQYLGVALLLACFAECLAVVGLLVPGTLIVLALAVLAGSGVLSLGETLMLAYLGGLAGDLVSYALGRRYHQNIRRLKGLRDHPEWLLRAELYFRRYGVASLLVGRFIGPLRPMLPMTAGMLDMPFPRFLLVSLLASAGWTLAYLLPGWTTGAALRLPLPEGFWPEAAVVAGSLAVLVGGSFYASLRGLRLTSPLVAGLCALGLLSLFLGWPRMVEFDQGLMQVIQQERNSGWDQTMIFLTRLGDRDIQAAAGALLCLVLLAWRQWRQALFAGLALTSTAVAVTALKQTFARTRPDVLLEPLTSYSFPSGHTSASFAFFLVLGVLAGRGQLVRMRMTWMLITCLPASLIAASRVFLGVHWPTDVIAGALLAASCCAACLALTQWRRPLQPLRARPWLSILPLCLGLLVAYAIWALPAGGELYRYR